MAPKPRRADGSMKDRGGLWLGGGKQSCLSPKTVWCDTEINHTSQRDFSLNEGGGIKGFAQETFGVRGDWTKNFLFTNRLPTSNLWVTLRASVILRKWEICQCHRDFFNIRPSTESLRLIVVQSVWMEQCNTAGSCRQIHNSEQSQPYIDNPKVTFLVTYENVLINLVLINW